MLDKLTGVEDRFLEVEKLLSDPIIVQDREAYQKYSREHADLNKIVSVFKKYKQTVNELNESKDLLKDKDPAIIDMAREEVALLTIRKEKLKTDLKNLLLPKDPNDDKNVIIEIRAGTGGEEAGLFASDLFRMYTRYAESKNWKVEVMTHHPTGVGGLKEIIAMIHGKGAYIVFSVFRKPRPREGYIHLQLPLRFCRKPKMSNFISIRVRLKSMCSEQPVRVVKV
jgi:peptide chain release factor 1